MSVCNTAEIPSMLVLLVIELSLMHHQVLPDRHRRNLMSERVRMRWTDNVHLKSKKIFNNRIVIGVTFLFGVVRCYFYK